MFKSEKEMLHLILDCFHHENGDNVKHVKSLGVANVFKGSGPSWVMSPKEPSAQYLYTCGLRHILLLKDQIRKKNGIITRI